MKQKGIYEAHPMTKEHGYLGEHRNNLESGYTSGGSFMGRFRYGTSKVLSPEESDTGKSGRAKDSESSEY